MYVIFWLEKSEKWKDVYISYLIKKMKFYITAKYIHTLTFIKCIFLNSHKLFAVDTLGDWLHRRWICLLWSLFSGNGGVELWSGGYVCLSLLLHVQTYHLRNLLFQDILLFPSLLRFINKCWDLTRNKVRCMYSIICREGYKCEVDSLLSFIHPILTSLCFWSISLMSTWGCGPN